MDQCELKILYFVKWTLQHFTTVHVAYCKVCAHERSLEGLRFKYYLPTHAAGNTRLSEVVIQKKIHRRNHKPVMKRVRPKIWVTLRYFEKRRLVPLWFSETAAADASLPSPYFSAAVPCYGHYSTA